MKPGTLILITGTIGAGKTTLAKKLSEERNAHWFNADEWMLAILKDPSDRGAEYERLRDVVEQMLWKEVQDLLTLNVTAILDNGFWAREERDQYLETAKSLGAKVELHYVEVKPEILWERVEKRNHDSQEFTMTKEEVERAISLFQPPTEEEATQYDHFEKYT